MLVARVFVYVLLSICVFGKRFETRCKVVRELLKVGMPNDIFLGQWVCLMEKVSHRDTRALVVSPSGKKSFGQFQIPGKWYRDGRRGGDCNIVCEYSSLYTSRSPTTRTTPTTYITTRPKTTTTTTSTTTTSATTTTTSSTTTTSTTSTPTTTTSTTTTSTITTSTTTTTSTTRTSTTTINSPVMSTLSGNSSKTITSPVMTTLSGYKITPTRFWVDTGTYGHRNGTFYMYNGTKCLDLVTGFFSSWQSNHWYCWGIQNLIAQKGITYVYTTEFFINTFTTPST